MDAKELRLGNLINDWEGNPFVVSFISHDETNDSDKPIPLTEEWLLKFGFDVYGSYREVDYLTLRRSEHDNCFYVCSVSTDGLTIEHVHQLQNLFHALTGEELTLKDS